MDKLEKCLREGEHGERHKGLRQIQISEQLMLDHVEKAKHNFQALTFFKENGYPDWSISAGFYALYHLLLALLAKHGFESRNQSCTFVFVQQLIRDGKCALSLPDLQEIYDQEIKADLNNSSKILDLREKYQYSTKTAVEEEEFVFVKKRVKYLFDKLRHEIER